MSIKNLPPFIPSLPRLAGGEPSSNLFRRLDEVVSDEQTGGCVEADLRAGQQLTGVTRAAGRQEGGLLIVIVTALLWRTDSIGQNG